MSDRIVEHVTIDKMIKYQERALDALVYISKNNKGKMDPLLKETREHLVRLRKIRDGK